MIGAAPAGAFPAGSNLSGPGPAQAGAFVQPFGLRASQLAARRPKFRNVLLTGGTPPTRIPQKGWVVQPFGRLASQAARRPSYRNVILTGGTPPTRIPQKGWVVQPFGRRGVLTAARRPAYRNVRLGLVRASPPVATFVRPHTRIVAQKAAIRASSVITVRAVIQYNPPTFAPRWYIKT